MIAALFALAAAMIIGGAAAVVQGFPYVRMESGLALVIAGSVAASSGAVLLGLGVVALGLRRLERAGARPPPRPEAAGPGPTPPSDGQTRVPPVVPPVPAIVPPPVEPPAVEAPAHAASSISTASQVSIAPPVSVERPQIEPALYPDAPPAAGPRPVEPELPMPGLTPSVPAPEISQLAEPMEPEPARDAGPVEDLFAAPEASPDAPPPGERPADEPFLRPGLDAAETPDPEPATERTVVGRYDSGANTYVMFEDGSIEADTPRGRFTFGSLDELKAFVEGGEPGARGAA